jgi:hypothetical protein
MGESRSFGNVGVRSLQSVRFVFMRTSKFLRDATSELSHFQGMCEPVVKNITSVGGYDLGHFGESRESAGILNPVPVRLSRGAVVQSCFRVKSESAVS